MRDASGGLEVLLLRRNARAGFVPGAYVFPGGRVDPADASPHALGRLDGVTPAQAAERLGLPEGDPPAIAYYVAALREAFEETGILVGAAPDPAATRGHDPSRIRDELLADRIGFGEALARLDRRVAAEGLEYLAHWITPVSEPRRYDTRFFAARSPEGAEPVIDAREMTGALWVTPSRAVAGARAGALPMILPTVRTLEQLAVFATVAEVLEALPGLEVPTILPGGAAGGREG
jgi:8-oxo-dGTP pyrophosphatase MutT (NUDIX family)